MKYFLRIVFQTVLLLFFSISIEANDSNAWLFKATPIEARDGRAENVTLTCRCDKDNNDDTTQPWMKDVTRILILKFDLNPNKPWKTYAKVEGANQPVVLVHSGYKGVTVQGQAGMEVQSYLSVTWDTLTQDTEGTYMCQVEGYTDLDTHVLSNTRTMTIGMPTMDWDAVLALLFEYEKMSDAVQMESDALQRQLDALQRKSEAVHSKGVSLLRDFANRQGGKFTAWPTSNPHQLPTISPDKQRTQAPNKRPNKRPSPWPRNEFALLKPESGCPPDIHRNSRWADGWIRLTTESTRGKYPNDDSVSDPSHLAEPVTERQGYINYFYIPICKQFRFEDRFRTPVWPKGTYCFIDSSLHARPKGFSQGKVFFDTENDYPNSTRVKHQDDYIGDVAYRRVRHVPYMKHSLEGTALYFRCRQDGDPGTPIELPVDVPFYLLRRGGRCQEVLNAKVTEETFTVDTEDDNNADARHNMVPDVSLNPLTFYTCHYQPTV